MSPRGLWTRTHLNLTFLNANSGRFSRNSIPKKSPPKSYHRKQNIGNKLILRFNNTPPPPVRLYLV